MEMVPHASNDEGVVKRYRNAIQDDGLRMIVYIKGKIQLAILFVWTICVGVSICSVRFIRRRANAEKMAERNWREHPIALSLGEISCNLLL